MDEGYEVAEADDGLAALREARAGPPDVIVLDLMMPTMNGWQFRAAQRHDPGLAGIPVVVVPRPRLPREVHEAGVAAHLHKPFELRELLGVLETLVGEAPSQDCPNAARPRGLSAPRTVRA